MTQNWDVFHEADKRLIVIEESANFEQNLRLADYLYHRARELGVLPEDDFLEDLEVHIRVARVLRSV
jgi:hypothetical protein